MGAKLKPQQRQHWYRIYITECMMCGRTEEERERVYGPPPPKDVSHYEYNQTACQAHFA